MHYFAKLHLGRVYHVFGRAFEKDVELEVTEKEYNYLKTVGDNQLTAEGNGYTPIFVPKFKLREVEDTVEEAVAREIEDAPDSLQPKKPGPKPKA